MNKYTIFLSCALLCNIALSDSHLFEALEKSHEYNYNIKSADLMMKVVEIEKNKAFVDGFLPKASLSWSYSKNDNTSKNALYNVKDSSHITTVSVSQNLFSGGSNMNSYKKAGHALDYQKLQKTSMENNIMLAAIESYFKVIYSERLLKLAKNAEDFNKKNIEIVNAKFKFGELTNTDIARAKYDMSNAVARRVSAENELEKSKVNYKNIIGHDYIYNNDYYPSRAPNIPSSLQKAVEFAKNHSPELKMSEKNYLMIKKDADMSISKNLPNIDARYSVQKSDNKRYNGKYESKTASIEASIALSPALYLDMSATRYKAQKAMYDYEESIKNLRNNVIFIWNDIETNKSNIKSAEDSVSAAETAFNGIKNEFDVGHKTNLDVLDAEQDLLNARQSLSKNKFEYYMSVYRMLSTSGILTIDNIQHWSAGGSIKYDK